MVVLCVAHFLVDFLCALLVTSIDSGNMAFLLLIYNFCAFALELPLGILLEGRCSPVKMAIVGILLVLGAWVFCPIPLLTLTVAGVGNALFHLGGGLFVMDTSQKAAPLGLFISPGALGIYWGAFCGETWIAVSFVIAILCVVWLWKGHKVEMYSMEPPSVTGPPFAILSLFFVVALRGFSGGAQLFPWRESFALWVLVAVVLGKALGGYLSDRFGAYPVGIGSLTVGALCFYLSDSPMFGLLGLFAFQLTMPITLWMLSRMTAKGFAFGLLTFGLFLGSLPTLLSYDISIPLPVLVLLSLMLFTFSLRKKVRT